MLAAGRLDWRRGERVRVFRARDGSAGLVTDRAETTDRQDDARNYDVEHYVRVLRENYASRLARAFAPADFEELFADPDQASLFPRAYDEIRSVLRGE
jgi:hypothetical protein